MPKISLGHPFGPLIQLLVSDLMALSSEKIHIIFWMLEWWMMERLLGFQSTIRLT
uniref:Uncharacterized protein n=1 Tax=Phakopsora pachyrhizi TaxID=170000 RepID=A0A0S1MKG6_PHAPC